jgi:2-dehydropantoate 2-reductase
VKFVVYGAGAVGGVLAAGLHTAGDDVVCIARGAHLEAVQRDGLRVDTPDGSTVVPVRAVGHPSEIDFTPEHAVLLAMKSQDTEAALDALVDCAPADIAVACVQNGVANEPRALGSFANVYGVVVMVPAAHLEPGVVAGYSAPWRGVLDVGRYPSGTDAVAVEISAAFERAGFSSVAQPEIMEWKYRKLLGNLGNIVEALVVREPSAGELRIFLTREATAVLHVAGIRYVSSERDHERRDGFVNPQSIAGFPRSGGSTWQSVARGLPTLETPYLNGEIVRLGLEHGVRTPLNAVCCELADEAVRDGLGTNSIPATEFWTRAGVKRVPRPSLWRRARNKVRSKLR